MNETLTQGISPTYYTKDRVLTAYLQKKMQHYMRKDRAVVLEKRPYTVQSGDTMYNLAVGLFGVDGEFNWTIIADINYLRKPDDLQPGEVIWLPQVIISELPNRLPQYEQNSSSAIAL